LIRSGTLRHLVFITDSWASRTILDEPTPYHRLGITQTAYAPAHAAALGIDHDARPSFADVMDVRADRMALEECEHHRYAVRDLAVLEGR
jgi:hypothetical protein